MAPVIFRYNVHYRNTTVSLERTNPLVGIHKKNESRDSFAERYYLVREDILPEAVLKTIQAKELLAGGKVKTIHEAVEEVA